MVVGLGGVVADVPDDHLDCLFGVGSVEVHQSVHLFEFEFAVVELAVVLDCELGKGQCQEENQKANAYHDLLQLLIIILNVYKILVN